MSLVQVPGPPFIPFLSATSLERLAVISLRPRITYTSIGLKSSSLVPIVEKILGLFVLWESQEIVLDLACCLPGLP